MDPLEKRNKEIYELIKSCKVCVVPDDRIITVDKLPYFSIIEGNIKDNYFHDNKNTKISKERYENLNSLLELRKFFIGVNREQLMHY